MELRPKRWWQDQLLLITGRRLGAEAQNHKWMWISYTDLLLVYLHNLEAQVLTAMWALKASVNPALTRKSWSYSPPQSLCSGCTRQCTTLANNTLRKKRGPHCVKRDMSGSQDSAALLFLSSFGLSKQYPPDINVCHGWRNCLINILT